MYQKEVNKLFNSEIFKLNNRKITGKFLTDHRINLYNQYLSNRKVYASINVILKSISYNTDSESILWNHKGSYLYFYKKRNGKLEETIPQSLSLKFIRNIPDDIFKSRIDDILMDYHILFNEDGNMIPIDQYPDIYISGGYLETFSTIYMEEDLTTNEIELLSAMTNRNNIIINLNNKIKLVKLKGKAHNPSKNKSNIFIFDKNNEGLVKLTLALAVNNKKNLLTYFKELDDDPKIMNKLVNILKIK